MDVQARPKLSLRQSQVIDRLTQGMNNREIGQSLGISEKTVKAHLTAIYKLTEVQSRTQLLLALKGQHAPSAETIPKKVAERILQALQNSTWGERHPVALLDLIAYIPDISGTVASVLKEYQ